MPAAAQRMVARRMKNLLSENVGPAFAARHARRRCPSFARTGHGCCKSVTVSSRNAANCSLGAEVAAAIVALSLGPILATRWPIRASAILAGSPPLQRGHGLDLDQHLRIWQRLNHAGGTGGIGLWPEGAGV